MFQFKQEYVRANICINAVMAVCKRDAGGFNPHSGICLYFKLFPFPLFDLKKIKISTKLVKEKFGAK